MELPRDDTPGCLAPPRPERERSEAAGTGSRMRWSFDLRIRPNGPGAFRVHLLSSPAGDEVAELVLPFPLDAIDRVMEELGGSVSGARRHLSPASAGAHQAGGRTPGEGLERIGTELFEALLPAPIRRRWQECVEEIGERPGCGLRLVLKSDPTCRATADLHRLPWELLRDPRTGAFLALSRKTQPIRQLAVDELAVLDAPAPARKLRILTVLSCPPGLDALDLARERRRIDDAVAGRPEIEVRVLENPTFGDLNETLRGEVFHVLHYMGHGAFDRASGQGSLLLAGADGEATRLPAERLAQVVRDVDSLRLVVLNACETGRSARGGEQPFTGLAHALIRSGVPAVLAMQLPVPDRAAVELSRVFYRHLAQGDAVDEALGEARVAVYAAEGTGGFGAWAVPVLFVRRPELTIFRPRRAAADPPGERTARRLRRWLPIPVVLLLTAAIVALFFVRTPWAGVEVDVEASRVTFTLAESRSVVDTLGLVELAVPTLRSVSHPGAGARTARRWSVDELEVDALGFLATASGDAPGGLSLDDACLPGGTRVDLERVTERDLRLSLELPVDGDPRCGDEVTASVGRGVSLRLVPGPAEVFDLGAGGRLTMVPRDRRIVLDLTLLDAAAARFHTPLVIDDLRFYEAREEVVGHDSSVRLVSTLRAGTVEIRPLGGGEPEEIEVEPEEPISLTGLSGRITALTLPEREGLGVSFRGRVEGIQGRAADGTSTDLMPTWSQSPWVVRTSAASSVLVAALVLFGQLGGLMRWGPARRSSRRDADPWNSMGY